MVNAINPKRVLPACLGGAFEQLQVLVNSYTQSILAFMLLSHVQVLPSFLQYLCLIHMFCSCRISVRPIPRKHSQPFAAIAGPIARSPTPALLLQIPAHCCWQTLLKAVARLPAQLAADPGWINRVTPVVAGAIAHWGDQAVVGGASGQQVIERTADRFHHLFVSAFPGCSV